MSGYFQKFYIERIYGPSFVITEVLFIVALAVLLTKFERKKECWIRFAVSLVAVALFHLLAASFVYAVSGDNHNMWLVCPLDILLYAAFASKYCARTRVVVSLLYFSNYIEIMSITESSSNLLDSAGLLPMENTPYAVCMYVILTAVVITYYKIYTLDKFSFVPVMCIALAAVYSVVALLLESFTVFSWMEVTRGYHIAVSLSFYIVSILFYFFIHHICKEVEANNDMMMKEKSKEEEKKYYELAAQNVEELKKIRHDIKNQYGYMKILIEQKEYGKAVEYFSQLEEKMLPALNAVASENIEVNAILNLERKKAAGMGIDMDMRCVVPRQLTVDKVDLTSLISNLVDNALEYVEMNMEGKGSVGIEIYQKGKYLFVNVENPVLPGTDRDKLLSLKTKKRNAELHGYGTKIVQDIAKKYNGCCVYDVADGKFVANAMLAVSN